MDFSWKEINKPTLSSFIVSGLIGATATFIGYKTMINIDEQKNQTVQTKPSHMTDSLSEIIIKDNDINSDGSLDREEIDRMLEY